MFASSIYSFFVFGLSIDRSLIWRTTAPDRELYLTGLPDWQIGSSWLNWVSRRVFRLLHLLFHKLIIHLTIRGEGARALHNRFLSCNGATNVWRRNQRGTGGKGGEKKRSKQRKYYLCELSSFERRRRRRIELLQLFKIKLNYMYEVVFRPFFEFIFLVDKFGGNWKQFEIQFGLCILNNLQLYTLGNFYYLFKEVENQNCNKQWICNCCKMFSYSLSSVSIH